MKLYSREIGYPLTLSLCLLSSESRFASAREDAGAELVKKPNVLVIFADDVGTGDVPGYWDDSNKVDMPHLTKLVEHGTTFTDAHSSPLCAPSRYMFLSGNYQHRGVRYPSVWNLNYKTNQFKKGQLSIADVLGHNGYDTAMFGKWHLGGKMY
jgi:arylsulfatase A-like enzyme